MSQKNCPYTSDPVSNHFAKRQVVRQRNNKTITDSHPGFRGALGGYCPGKESIPPLLPKQIFAHRTHQFRSQWPAIAEYHREARVASVSDLMKKAEYLPMGNLHGESGQAVRIRGNYEKQVKVRGHHRPLTKNTGRQSRPGCNAFSDFKVRGHVGSPYKMHNKMEEPIERNQD